MANPFGSTDQTLSKNTGHTNQANLVRALIPRSASKWVEVISGSLPTVPASGTYDSNGYFFGANGTRQLMTYTLPSSLNPSSTWTIIIGATYNSGGSLGTGSGVLHGLRDSVGGVAFFSLKLERYSRGVTCLHTDSNGVNSDINNASANPGNDVFSASISNQAGNQKGFYKASGGSLTSIGTGTSTLGGSAVCDVFDLWYASLYGVQYAFLYDSYLSDANIESIMDDPGAVISYAASGSAALSGSAATGGHGTQVPNFSIPL